MNEDMSSSPVMSPAIAAIYPEIAGRDWQQKGLQAWSAAIDSNQQIFFTEACPGSGKTRVAIAAAKLAFDKRDIDMVIVVAPTERVHDQWVEAGIEYGLRLRRWSSEQLGDSIITGANPTGIITTYAQMSNDLVREAFEVWTRRRRVLVVLDEIHHCGENRKWADSVQIAFKNATRLLVLSGTPFRSDDRPIPFIMGEPDENGLRRVRNADAKYTYAEAVRDRVCRSVAFQKVNTTVQLEDESGMRPTSLDDPSVEDEWRNKAYRAAICPERCDFSRYMLAQAWAELQRIRRDEQPDAAMLIIAASQDNARDAARIMGRIAGQRVSKAWTDLTNSQGRIEAFASEGCTDPVLVSVAMVAEGVDIPRIRVIVYLSTIMTEMWFRQIVGRAVRMQNGPGGDQYAKVFIPQMPALVSMAHDIEREVEWAVQATEDGPNPVRRPTAGQNDEEAITPVFIVHGSTDERSEGVIVTGSDVTEEELLAAREYQKTVPALANADPLVIALARRDREDLAREDRGYLRRRGAAA
jgi:superfamily II DNA or RNA helicase